MMKKYLFWTLILIGYWISMSLQFACTSIQEEKKLVERGKYLVEFGSCNTCHTPKIFTQNGFVIDTTRILSGHPENMKISNINSDLISVKDWIVFNNQLTACIGPWGIVFSTNLTPDDETGIGLWTETYFTEAMRTGTHVGVYRTISQPMCWVNMTKLSDDDLRAIFTYLKQLVPVKNAVPIYIPK